MDAAKRARLEKSWAHAFRTHGLTLIDEQRWAKYFHADNGRPNKSVRLVVSVLLLKEINDLTDAEALEQLEWNSSWHYALDVTPEEAHTCQKTLHNFRALLLQDDEGAGLFESTTAQLIAAAGLKTRRQRQDSTHIVPNIRLLSRLGLFVDTLTRFFESLRKDHPRLCNRLPAEMLARYLDREGYFGDSRASEAPRRLEQAAMDAHRLVRWFGEHPQVSRMESFQLVARLYAEQCVPPDKQDPPKIELREAPSSSSLQSPSDPDVTYGFKGKGYEAQITETCDPENPFEVVTAVSVNNANESDQHHVVPGLEQVERTCGAAPEMLHTDAGYCSGDNIIAAQRHGTRLLAPVGSKGPDQARLSLVDFDLDEVGEIIVSCPAGQVPKEHRPARGGGATLASFSKASCRGCPARSTCPAETRGNERVVRFTPAQAAIARRRIEQETAAFKEAHKLRSGIEATNSELKRRHGFGRLRVRRRPRVTLAVCFKALALNLKRYVVHLTEAAATPAPCCA